MAALIVVSFLLLSVFSFFTLMSLLSELKVKDEKIQYLIDPGAPAKTGPIGWVLLYPIIALSMMTGYFQMKAKGTRLVGIANILAICDVLLIVIAIYHYA